MARNRTIALRSASHAWACSLLLLACGAGGCNMGNPPDRAGGTRGGQPAAGPRGASAGDARLAELNAPVSATQLREKALETIVGFARDENAQVRGAVVEAAGHSPRRLRSIIEAGLKDENAGVRTIAATVVGRTQQRDLLVATRPLLEDAQGEVRASAIFALAKNGVNVNQSPLGAMLLNDASPWVSRQAAFVIGELGNKSALPLLQSAARTRMGNLPAAQQRPFQLMLTEAMVKLGDEAQKPALRAALFPDGTSDLEGMALAVQILGETRDHEAKGQLISIVQYRDANGQSFPGEIRLGAAAALTKMGSGEGAIALADEYLFSSDERLRMQAANVYGEVRGTQAWGRLNKLMGDPNPLVRVAAASAVLKASARGG